MKKIISYVLIVSLLVLSCLVFVQNSYASVLGMHEHEWDVQKE